MKFCGNCGQSIPDDARACPYCGAMQGGAPAPAAKKAGFDAKGIFEKYKKWCILAGVVIGLLLCWLLIGKPLIFGNYKTPIKQSVNYVNDKDFDMEERFVNMYNGLGKSELKKIYKIISSSENFKDFEDAQQDGWKDFREGLEDEYGKGWKVDYDITDKDELDDDDLKDIKNDYFKSAGKSLIATGKAILDLDNDDLKELAEDMGLKKDDLKELADLLKELGQVLKDAEPKAGYEVDIDTTIKGDDDEDEDSITAEIVKVGSRWIALPNELSSISSVSVMNYLYGIGFYGV